MASPFLDPPARTPLPANAMRRDTFRECTRTRPPWRYDLRRRPRIGNTTPCPGWLPQPNQGVSDEAFVLTLLTVTGFAAAAIAADPPAILPAALRPAARRQ